MTDGVNPPEASGRDWTGAIIVAMLAPVFFLITYLFNADLALAACIVLGMTMVAIRLRWRLRKHLWFWATIVLILALHVPLVLFVPLPHPQGNTPMLFYTLPIGIADGGIVLGALSLAEKLFSNGDSSEG
jgi:hypothetical protein